MLETLFVAIPILFSASVFSVALIEEPKDVIVEHVRVSDTLEGRGYSAATIGFLVRQTIQDITDSAGSYQDARVINVSAQDLSPLESILGVLNITRAVNVTQIYLGMVDSIVEIHVVEAKDDKITIHVGVKDAKDFSAEQFRSFYGEIDDFENLVRGAARFIVEIVQPYIYAAHTFKVESSLDDRILHPDQDEFPLTLEFIKQQAPHASRQELAWYLNLIGLIEMQQQDWGKAIHYFRKSLKAQPGFVLANINWGWALSSLGAHEAAIRKFREVDAATPGLPITHLYWAVALFHSGDFEGALAQLDRVDAISRDVADSYMIRAEIYGRSPGKEQDAAKYERKAKLARARRPRQSYFMPL